MESVLDNITLENLLKDTVVTVNFTKQSDGSERTMICTKNFALIPAADYPKQESMPPVVNEDIMKVYDMEKCAWRSFRKDSIISYGI
jgi:hypothetical protein